MPSYTVTGQMMAFIEVERVRNDLAAKKKVFETTPHEVTIIFAPLY